MSKYCPDFGAKIEEFLNNAGLAMEFNQNFLELLKSQDIFTNVKHFLKLKKRSIVLIEELRNFYLYDFDTKLKLRKDSLALAKFLKEYNRTKRNLGSQDSVIIARYSLEEELEDGNVTILDLYSYNLKAETVKLMEPMLRKLNLKKVLLGDNQIGPEGLRIIADLTESWPELKELSITNNNNVYPSIGYLLEKIQGKNLEFINLSMTNLTDDDLDLIGKFIQKSKVATLNLNNNNFTDEAIIKFLDAVRNSNIENVAFHSQLATFKSKAAARELVENLKASGRSVNIDIT